MHPISWVSRHTAADMTHARGCFSLFTHAWRGRVPLLLRYLTYRHNTGTAVVCTRYIIVAKIFHPFAISFPVPIFPLKLLAVLFLDKKNGQNVCLFLRFFAAERSSPPDWPRNVSPRWSRRVRGFSLVTLRAWVVGVRRPLAIARAPLHGTYYVNRQLHECVGRFSYFLRSPPLSNPTR